MEVSSEIHNPKTNMNSEIDNSDLVVTVQSSDVVNRSIKEIKIILYQNI